MNYKEPFLSRCIFNARSAYFRFLKLNHKLHKIWKQRKEYFSKSYWTVRNSSASEVKTEQISPSPSHKSEISDSEELLPANLSDKLAVYTCIFGNYDMICEPLYKSKFCEYYIITDMDVPSSSVWKKLDFEKPDGFDEWGPSYKNRWCKMHPHLIFPNHRYSMYVDGIVKLLTDMYVFVPQLNNKIMGIHKYPLYDCFYKNSDFLLSLGLVDEELNARQIETYRNEGFPEHYGYFECGIILRDHHRQKCIDVMNEWWTQYNTFVHRDQQGLMYSLWKNGLTKNDIFCLGDNLRKSPRFKINEHNRKHAIVKERGPQS